VFAKITVLGIPPLHPGAPPSPNNNVDVAFWEPRNVAKKSCFPFARDLLLAPNIVSGGGGGLQMPMAPCDEKPFVFSQTPVPMCRLMSPNLIIL